MLPFTREQFFDVFAAYNAAIWPAQLLAVAGGVVAVLALARPSRLADRIVAGVLAAMWAWTGIAYHAFYFVEINRTASVFAALFVAQAVAFVAAGLMRPGMGFRAGGGLAGWLGGFLIAYAALLYPLIGLWAGHDLIGLPAFGVTPCPVTIFSFGMLLFAAGRVPLWLLAVPFAWSLIGGSAAFLLGVPQDWMLLVGGLVAAPLLALRGRYPRAGRR